MSDYPGALDMPTAHFWAGSQGEARRWIILHGTAGFQTAQEVASYFQTNNPPTSVHYVIGRDGVIVQCVAEGDSAWGNGVISAGHDVWWDPAINPNLQTFSIEHVKPSLDNSDVLTPAQEAASFRLIAHLCAAHGIPARAADASGGITGHYSIDPVNRARCPGPYPWAALYTSLGTGGGYAMGWTTTASGAVDSAGHTVGEGLAPLLTAGAADGERSETAYNGIGDVYVDLADGNVATWTHAEGARMDRGGAVIEALLGELSSAQAALASAQAQLATLNAQLAGASVSGAVESVNAMREIAKALKALGA